MFLSARLRTSVVALAATALLVAGCSEQSSGSDGPSSTAPSQSSSAAAPESSTASVDADTTSVEIPAAVDKALKVALVIRTTQGGWLETYTKAVTDEVSALGGDLQIYDSQNDLGKMATNVTTAVNAGVDILLIDNGTAAALAKPVAAAVKAGIPVVSYDTDPIDGVVAINQDDKALALGSIQALDKDFNGKANIVVLSVAGYAPLDHRLAALNDYLKEHPGIKVVSQTGTVSSNASLDTKAQVEALLKAHPNPGDINAIWTDWNDFSVGAALALKAAKRTDIKIYTVDVTEQNLPYFWDANANLAAVSASNPATIATSQVRLGYQEVAGEQVKDLTVEPVVLTKADLPDAEFSYADLATHVPAWTDDTTTWPAWIDALEAKNK